jgi:hypothetical protein
VRQTKSRAAVRASFSWTTKLLLPQQAVNTLDRHLSYQLIRLITILLFSFDAS